MRPMKRAKARKIDHEGKTGDGDGGFLRELKRICKNHASIDRKMALHPVMSETGVACRDGHELKKIPEMDNYRKTFRADSA